MSPMSASAGKRPTPGCVRDMKDGLMVMSFGDVPPGGGWTRVRQEGLSGLVFRRDLNEGIVGAGEEGVGCVKWRADSDGEMYVTLVSSAPDVTENNDLWLRMKGLMLVKEGSVREVGEEWTKGYQNKGRGQLNDRISSVDFNPHALVIKGVSKGQIREICWAGRSYRFNVFKLVVRACGGKCALNMLNGVGGGKNLVSSMCV